MRVRLCLAGLLLIVPGVLAGAESGVAATVNGETITSAQLDAVVRQQLQAIEERARQIRQTALEKLIDNLLLEQAARRESVPVDDYLRRHVESVTVPDAEVDAAYERSREQFPGVLAAEAKYRIRRTLEDNRRAAAVRALLEGLRRQARITNHLREDRLAALDFAGQAAPSLGSPDAPVTIVEFSDFECPYCRDAQTAVKRVLNRWPGRVRLVFRHFPLERHMRAFPAAQAAVCADRQERFWPFHDALFAAPRLDEPALRAAASAAGLDGAQFEACWRGEAAAEAVRQDMLLGRTVGVDGTPAFFVNRQPVAGARELEAAVGRILGAGAYRRGGGQ